MRLPEERITGRVFFMFSALAVNGLILMMIIHLSDADHQEYSDPLSDPVFLADYRPPKPPPLTRKIRRRPEPEKKIPKSMPKFSIRQKSVKVSCPKPKFKVPEVKFEISPVLTTGMAIAPPPPEPKPVVREVIPEPEPIAREPVPQPRPVVREAPPDPEPEAEPVVSKAPPEPAQTPVKEAIPSEFGLDEVDQRPSILRKVNPLYPYRAKRRNLSGKVVVKFLVSPSGHVEKPRVVESDPEGVFEKNALQAVRKWRFRPGYYQGKAVATWVVLPIHFRLSG